MQVHTRRPKAFIHGASGSQTTTDRACYNLLQFIYYNLITILQCAKYYIAADQPSAEAIVGTKLAKGFYAVTGT